MIRNLLTGDLIRLAYVTRFSTCRRSRTESVAEHSFYTTLFAYALAVPLRESGYGIDVGVVLEKALLHDLEECRSGDFPRPFKYSTQELAEACAIASKLQCGKLIWQNFDPAHGARRAFRSWESSKDNSAEGKLVAFADFLSVLCYLWHEIRASNFSVAEHVDSMEKYLQIFKSQDYNFVRSYVNEAETVLQEVMRGKQA